ncbi:angiotensin-converting enzyme isoform X1 [Nilaparvata lugens]|uniref:angiotensin-converting enzyme isoform X1 n=1 Tax=Nilaparvata lugens TaxID=108931 RepID=UPI00193CFAF5|nr:angiotensin-converting enzyme isoform X1 [Nilaparvata lugens]XP_039290346.1 angiotensin-converting enzyme isoform X1 [Nilaparvata lugens]
MDRYMSALVVYLLCILLPLSPDLLLVGGQINIPGQDNTAYLNPNSRPQFDLDPRLKDERLREGIWQLFQEFCQRKALERHRPDPGGSPLYSTAPPLPPLAPRYSTTVAPPPLVIPPRRDTDERLKEELLQTYLNQQDRKLYEQGQQPQYGADVSQRPPSAGGVGPRPLTEQAQTVHDQEVRAVLAQIDNVATDQCRLNVHAQWDFETSVSDVSQVQALEAQEAYTELQARIQKLISNIPREGVRDFRLRRQLNLLSVIGASALPPDQRHRYHRLINEMLAVYNSATVCAYNEPLRCDLRLEPEVSVIMAQSRDWDQLQHTWVEWHRRSGLKIRDLYEQLVELCNYAANLNNMTNFAEYWMWPYETPGLRFELEEVWEEIRPLYEQLHSYVRRKLRDLYGPEKLSREAPLPAHILGNMWAQSWTNILDVTIPYPGKNYPDVTPQMLQQGYTPATLFRLAEDFYLSMNMSAMPPEFWERSIIQQPHTPAICQPSAWDFCDGQDYRIKMCAQVNMKDLITAHHEMAHIQYFINYRNQPKVFRDGANPALHEAISDAISLSVSTPRHLQQLGLLNNAVDDTSHNINHLFAQALEKLPFLPFSLALDFWRWDLFQGNVPRDRYNCHWWDLREKYGGVKPPVLRSENDFDPGAKYHVPANIPYIRYFIGTVLQFQLHRSMCLASGWGQNPSRQPLHKCDIYRSKEAGNILKRLMEKGASEPWSEVLFSATGESRLDGRALRDYFRPLEEWLRSENLRTGEIIGWSYDGDYCKYSIETANLQVYGGFYGAASSLESSVLVLLFTTIVLVYLSAVKHAI